MGIRIARGASAREIRCLVLGQVACLAGAGVVVGLLAARFVTPLLSSLLFGVDARDSWTFLSIAVLMVVIYLSASSMPARKAARVQPLEALHYE